MSVVIPRHSWTTIVAWIAVAACSESSQHPLSDFRANLIPHNGKRRESTRGIGYGDRAGACVDDRVAAPDRQAVGRPPGVRHCRVCAGGRRAVHGHYTGWESAGIQCSAGSVTLVRPNGSGDPLVSTFVSGLRKPQAMVFHTVSGTTYLYIAESNQINRFVYTAGDLTAQGRRGHYWRIARLDHCGSGRHVCPPVQGYCLRRQRLLTLNPGTSCNLCL